MAINVARVPVSIVHVGTVSPQSTMGGLIVPLANVQIQTSLSEPTDAVYVQEGDAVHQGQVLARLDTADLQAQLQSDLGQAASDQAKITSTTLQSKLTITQNGNTINSARATLRQTQQTLATDTTNLQRDQQLLASGYLSQQQYDQQHTLVANDQQAVQSAQVGVSNIVAQVQTNGSTNSGLQGATIAAALADEQSALGLANQVRAQIAKATIVSPIDGVIVNRNLNPGEYPGTRQIFTVQQIDHVYAVLNGGGAQVLGVQPGSLAQIVSTDRASVRGTARVIAVLDQITPGSTNFVVKAELANPGHQFRSGMVVAGVVHRVTSRGLIVPLTAFVDDTQSTVQTIVKAPPPTGGGSGPAGTGSNGSGAGAGAGRPGPSASVPNTIVKTIPVTMLAEDGSNAIVQGVTAGEPVISNGQLGLADGQPVEPATATGTPGRPRSVADR